MAEFYLLLFLLLCAWILIKVVIDPKLIYQYPFFLGCMFSIFLVPQAIGLVINPHLVPQGSMSAIFLMCFLCILMAIMGYNYGPYFNMIKVFNNDLKLDKVVHIALVYTLFGWLFLFLINNDPASRQKGNWSGILTIYVTFYQVINIAFAIFIFLFIRQRKRLFLLFAVLSALPIVQIIVFGGRREPTALFILTIAMALFFLKGLNPPRFLVILGLGLTMLIIPLIGTYRQLSEEDPLLAISSINFKEDFVKYYKDGKEMELRVAGHMMDATSFYRSYDFGSDYWNEMVFRYFPGQIFGKELKASLMIGSHGQDRFYRQFDPLNGLTTTCVGDTFRHFGYFGCLFYFLLGGFFRSLWTSLNEGNFLVKIFYIICMVQALLSVSHGTVSFLPGVFHMYIYIYAW